MWTEDPRSPSGWRWSPSGWQWAGSEATTGPAPEAGPVPVPSSTLVFDPAVGADGGGASADGGLSAIDPDSPVAHVDELTGGSPASERAAVGGPHQLSVAGVDCPACGAVLTVELRG